MNYCASSLFTPLAAICLGVGLQAQTLQWGHGFAGTPLTIASANGDNVYLLVDPTDTSEDIDPGPQSTFVFEPYVAIYSSSGAFIDWIPLGSGTCRDMAVSSAGEVYVLKTGVVMHYSASGTLMGTVPVATIGKRILLDETGAIYVSDFLSMHKYSAAGVELWNNSLVSSVDLTIDDVHLGPNNSVWLAGSFEGVADFDPGVGVEEQDSDSTQAVFLLTWASDGSFQHINVLPAPGANRVALDVNEAGMVLLAGEFREQVIVNGVSYPAEAYRSTFLTLFSAEAISLWTVVLDNGYVEAAVPDNVLLGTSACYLTGKFPEQCTNFNPNGPPQVYCALGGSDAFTACYAFDGTLSWFTHPSPLNTSNWPDAILSLQSDGLVVADMIEYDVDLEDGSGTHPINAEWLPTFYLAKYADFTGVLSVEVPDELQVYPNPVPAGGAVTVPVTGMAGSVRSFQLFDNAGRLVRSWPSMTSTHLSLAGIQPGLYSMRLSTNGAVYSTIGRVMIL